MKKAHLALADGTIFPGFAYGAEGSVVGEVVYGPLALTNTAAGMNCVTGDTNSIEMGVLEEFE